jgi:hypothetical protein
LDILIRPIRCDTVVGNGFEAAHCTDDGYAEVSAGEDCRHEVRTVIGTIYIFCLGGEPLVIWQFQTHLTICAYLMSNIFFDIDGEGYIEEGSATDGSVSVSYI